MLVRCEVVPIAMACVGFVPPIVVGETLRPPIWGLVSVVLNPLDETYSVLRIAYCVLRIALFLSLSKDCVLRIAYCVLRRLLAEFVFNGTVMIAPVLFNGSLRNCPAEREASHCGRTLRQAQGKSRLALRVGGLVGWWVGLKGKR